MKILCDSGIVEGRKEGKWTHYKISAVIYVLVGLVIAIAGGTLIEKLHLDNQVEEYIKNCKMLDIPQEELHFKDRMKYTWEQVLGTAKKVFPYVLVGVGIGTIIHNWIPEDIIVKILGSGNPLGAVIAAIAGVPMYAGYRCKRKSCFNG